MLRIKILKIWQEHVDFQWSDTEENDHSDDAEMLLDSVVYVLLSTPDSFKFRKPAHCSTYLHRYFGSK